MLEIRNAVAVPAQEHRQVIVDVVLGEVVRKLLEVQHCLRDLQAIIINATVGILSQTELLCKERYAFPEFGNCFYRLVQVSIGHGVCGVGD